VSPKAKKREYSMAVYTQRRLLGLCVECSRPSRVTARCPSCAEREKDRQKRYRRSPKHRERKAANDAQLRKRWRASGRCCFCGKPANGRAMCEYHRLKGIAANRAWRARNRNRPRPTTIEVVYVEHELVVNQPPPGWTVEADIAEEYLALSELTLMRKISQEAHV
jgi:hypothetical protein